MVNNKSGATASWRALGTDEDARAYLQARLVVLSRVMFASFIVLLAFMYVFYAIYPTYRPRYNNVIYAVAAVGMALLVVIWRFLLLRRTLTIAQLRRVDVFYLVGTGSIFGASGALAYDLRSSAYLCLIYACMLVVLRATIVPSTGVRTALIGVATCLPMTFATIFLGLYTEQDVPGPIYVAGGVLICSMAISLTVISSRILYDLRQKISEVMQLGAYTVEKKIGEGGNGVVYRARHALLRRPTAVKLMLPHLVDAETVDRFEREVQNMSQLTHANTVAVYDYGRSHEGVFYYVMEYLDGIDLEQLVSRFGAQPSDRVVPILMQVCGALAEAHRRGLIHRDIKPANIILSERGDVPDVAKVVDFGLAKEIAAQSTGETRAVMGTPAYLAPETMTDPDKLGPPSDLYALGAVGYFLVTGKRVFEGATTVDICVQHVVGKPIPPSARPGVVVPRELEALILQCLAKDPADRPASANELARRLREVPIGNAWSEQDALQWWAQFRNTTATRGTPATGSITVDLGTRTPSTVQASL